jgi:Aspartyl protease/PDZ domain
MKSPLYYLSAGMFLLLCTVSAGWAADDTQSLLARAKQAAGGEAVDRIRTTNTHLKIKIGGIEGTGEFWEDVRTGYFRSELQLGPASEAEGFDGTTTWSLDSAKQPVKEEGDDAKKGNAADAYRRTMAYWYPERWPGVIESFGRREEAGRMFDVLRITPKGGRSFELWVDANTSLIDRTIEKAETETHTTFYSDYREVQGAKVAFALRVTNGETRYDQFLTVESVTINPAIDASRFAMPAPPPPDFAIAGGSSATVPFELLNNHTYVQVKVNGKGPYRFLCDTGGENVITPELARALDLKAEGTLQGKGVGEKSEDVALTKVNSVALGGVTLSSQVFAVFPLADLSKVEGIQVDGLVGYELFKRFTVKVDYANSRLTFTLPSARVDHGAGTVVPFRFNDHIPQVNGEIDGITGTFDIDTGSRSSLDLMTSFIEVHNLSAKYLPKFEATTGFGFGGPARSAVSRALLLKLGSVEVRNPVTGLTLQKKGSLTSQYVAGNVGAGVLKRFNITFDYARQQLIFERNANDALRDTYERAGWWLNMADGGFEVLDVVPGGPAAEAGLKVGDRVLAVDGKAATQISLPEFRERLRSDAPGSKLVLRIASGGATREVTLTLRDLV